MDEDRNSADRIAELEQSLIDERALRADAQARARALEQRAALWRSRAEERAERITKLETDSQRPASLRWLGSFRGAGSGNAPSERPPRADAPTHLQPTQPAIPGTSVLHNATGALAAVLGEGNAQTLDAQSWDSVDLVVVDPARLPADDLEGFRTWVEGSPRPPTMVVANDPGAWPRADATVGTGGLDIPDPIGHEGRGGTPTAELLSSTVRDEFIVRDDNGNPVGLLSEHGSASYASLGQAGVNLAARGVAVGHSVDEVRALGQGARARRWAWSRRDPAVLLDELLTGVGVSHRSPWPSVGGLLVSNRPDRVLRAIDSFLAQRYGHKELVVGCHGFDCSSVEEHVKGHDSAGNVRVLQLPATWSLGRCLNEAASVTSASVLAKIDDDDFYGPNYILDAVLAKRYSGAAVVGKASQFTYVESSDITVLRRGATEETFVGGVLTGATLVFDRAIWEAVRFPDRPRMVDVHFLAGVRAAGASVYANGRWEFVYCRNETGHTWVVDDEEFLSGSEIAWDGWDPTRSILSELA